MGEGLGLRCQKGDIFAQMQRDLKVGKLPQNAYNQQAVEILTALRKLGEKVRVCCCHWLWIILYNAQLSPVELEFLTTHTSAALAEFEKVSPQTGL